MRKMTLLILMGLTMIFAGCGTKTQDKQVDTDSPTVTSAPTEEAQNPEVTTPATPTPKELILPVLNNDTGKVLIQTVSIGSTYPYNSYIITSVNGERVVVDPTQMPLQKFLDINPAAIVNTHTHSDHQDVIFSRTYDVPKLNAEEGVIDTKDFHIYTVLSSHSDDNLSTSNVIMVFEVDGLRIAHMGDIGQTYLTEDQLEALGKIDIAFMQFENSFSDMSLKNEKGFHLIEQLNPTIVIPTHYTNAALPVLEEKYGAITEFENILEISKDDIPEGSLNVYRILNNHVYY